MQWELNADATNEIHYNKTKFVCYEDILNTTSHMSRTILREIFQWYYPESYNPLPSSESDDGNMKQDFVTRVIAYHGWSSKVSGHGFKEKSMKAHSTNHDLNVRSHLRSIVEELDKHVFNGAIQTFHQALLCG